MPQYHFQVGHGGPMNAAPSTIICEEKFTASDNDEAIALAVNKVSITPPFKEADRAVLLDENGALFWFENIGP